MKRGASLIVVVVLALAASCFGGKKGGRGTNVGPGSDEGGPWTQGGPRPAAMPLKR